MMSRARAFAMFWYDFIIGDDWKLAAGAVVALVVTALLSRTSVPAWWVLPAAVVLLLPFSVWVAARGSRGSEN
jgi:tryptophan-rich sensory protein